MKRSADFGGRSLSGWGQGWIPGKAIWLGVLGMAMAPAAPGASYFAWTARGVTWHGNANVETPAWPEDGILNESPVVWQLIGSPDAVADPPDLANPAGGYVGGGDVVWAARHFALGDSTNEEGTWEAGLYSAGALRTTLVAGHDHDDGAPWYVYQRIFQARAGEVAAGTWYYESSPVRVTRDACQDMGMPVYIGSAAYRPALMPDRQVVAAWGAGGGGGKATTTGNNAGGGGGGGGYARSSIAVTPGSTQTVTVGIGGTAATAGGASWFGSTGTVYGAGGSAGGEGAAVGAGGSANVGNLATYAGGTGGEGMTTGVLVLVGLLASAFNDRALGILVLAFLLAAYTVVRHLADIELRESGQVVLQGLARPVRRNKTLLAYIVGDGIVLGLAVLLGLALLDAQDGVRNWPLKQAWLRAAPLDVVVPFVFLLLAKAYSRVWYLARVSEYAATGLAVVAGYAAVFGLRLLGIRDGGGTVQWALYYLLLAGTAGPVIVMTRAALRVVQDLMPHLLRGTAAGGSPPARALVCGAGYRTTLFLRQVAYGARDRVPLDVVGIVSDDAAITGHYVHGMRVLGTCRELAALVVQHRIDVLYLVEPIAAAELEHLRESLKIFAVRLVCWDVVETELPLHA